MDGRHTIGMEAVKKTLSPKDLAAAVGVSESSLKRWADSGTIQATRTEGGHRRIAISEAIRFIRESKLELVKPEVLGIRELAAAPETDTGGGEGFLDALRNGDAETARGLLMWQFLQGESGAALCDGPIREALEELGTLWRDQRDGIFLEHRATDICLQAMDQLRVLQPVAADAPVLVGGAPEGDPYMLPSLMAATSLALEGFRAINLGAETPGETLLHAVDVYSAPVAWLSITSATISRARYEDILGELLDGMESRDAFLIVGGQMTTRVRHLRHPRLHFGASMAELVAFARGRLA